MMKKITLLTVFMVCLLFCSLFVSICSVEASSIEGFTAKPKFP